MSILVDKNTKLAVSGLTGREGSMSILVDENTKLCVSGITGR